MFENIQNLQSESVADLKKLEQQLRDKLIGNIQSYFNGVNGNNWRYDFKRGCIYGEPNEYLENDLIQSMTVDTVHIVGEESYSEELTRLDTHYLFWILEQFETKQFSDIEEYNGE